MSNLITYDDKIRLKSQNVSEKYKVTAGDMNEIKSVVNTNVELVDEINKPENWVLVGAEEPTDGRKVWFKTIDNSIVVNNQEWYSKPKVLWTNPNPTSVFPAQDITLSNSLADFDYYEVLFLMSKFESLCVSTGLIPASMGTSLLSLRNSGSTGTISRYRDITKTNDTTLAVTTCYQSIAGNVSQDTKIDRVIPFKILGYKE